MWSSLPSNLRTVLGTALLLGVAVAAAAFTLSFFALREAAEDPALKFGAGHAWLFPIGVDMALVFFEVLLLGASMVRVQERGKVVQYPRAIPFLLVIIAGAGTVYFNATRVPEQVRPIALAVPVASILVTLGLAYLLKMLAAASGAEAIHLAPPALEPSRIVRKADVLEGELVRTYSELPTAQNPRWTPSELRQAGHPAVVGNGGAAVADMSKRQQVEAYLRALDGDAAARLFGKGPAAAGREVSAALRGQGLDVSARYCADVLNDLMPARRGSGARRRGATPRR
jgi:Protein of unknown function (DUF2637)